LKIGAAMAVQPPDDGEQEGDPLDGPSRRESASSDAHTDPTPVGGPATSDTPPAETWARDVAIFLPPIARSWSDRDSYDITRRIQAAMNRVATPRARFKSESRQVTLGEEATTAPEARLTVYTITRTDLDPEQRLLDIYPLNYHHHLEGDFSELPLWKRILLVAWATVVSIVRALTYWRSTRSKGVKEMWQLAVSALGLVALAVYLIMLLVAVAPDVANAVRTVAQAGQPPSATVSLTPTATGATGTPAPSAPIEAQRPPGPFDTLSATFSWISRIFATVIAALALYTFKIDDMKRVFVRLGEIAYAMVSFFENQTTRVPVSTQLHELASDIAQRPYKHLYIIGYSFGSIIALDTLFPRNEDPDKIFSAAEKRTLITIGCPFDYIRSLWPDFWTRRHVVADLPQAWINVYIRRDILGSNFRANTEAGPPTHGINSPLAANDGPVREADDTILASHVRVRMPNENIMYAEDRDLGWTDAVRFVGYKEHANYWSANVNHISAFDRIIRITHGADSALA
jgi:hypothetical protein